MNALVYVDIDQGIYKGKMKVALNEKRKKLRGFSFSINMANFEAFLLLFKLTKNPLFLKSADIVGFLYIPLTPWPNRHNSLHEEHIPHILFLSRVANSKYPCSTFQSHGPMVVNGLKKMVPGFPKKPLGACHINGKNQYLLPSM